MSNIYSLYLDCVLILHSLFFFKEEKHFLCYNLQQLEPVCVCIRACEYVLDKRTLPIMKRNRMGTVFEIWLQRGYLMIWERLSKWRKLGDLLDSRQLQHGWAQQDLLGTSCVTSDIVTLVQGFHSTMEQEHGYIRCKGFFIQNYSGLRPGQWLIAGHSNFNFFYINIMRIFKSFSWKFWDWDIGENKETLCELSEE